MTAIPETHQGACHCGAVRFQVRLKDGLATARRCDCSYCAMRGAVAVSAKLKDLVVLQGEDQLATYRFNTGEAEHHFCSVCGITPTTGAVPIRTKYGINAACLAGVSPFDFAKLPVLDGISHPSDRAPGLPPRVAGTLLFVPAPAE